jgi:hypothetical protein
MQKESVSFYLKISQITTTAAADVREKYISFLQEIDHLSFSASYLMLQRL